MVADHTVKSFDEELKRLNQVISQMGGLVEAQIQAAVDALVKRDAEAAAKVVRDDARIDELEQQVSSLTLRLLALRQPMAVDLRQIVSALKISSDLERIGDYAANVAKRSTALNVLPPLPHVSGLQAIGVLAVQQVRDVMTAYRDSDIELAQRVRARDAEIDVAYTALFRELLTYMMEDARSITACTHLLFMAKNIERIGDHATNIAENVWFLVKGEEQLPPREKRDDSSTTVTP